MDVPTSTNKSANADLGRWANVEDDNDEDEIEEGETHPNEMNQPNVLSNGLRSAQHFVVASISTKNVDMSRRGLPSQIVSFGTVIASSPGRVKVVNDDILTVVAALKEAARAFTKVGKHHRGRTASRGILHGVDADHNSHLNLEDIATAVVGNRNQDIKPVNFSPRVTRSKRGAR
ncbi:hypothetical protein NE237_007488 [Protea cynaroides]|uniref:Uncharacterized protein n=1 Tax=Protea cynaroides TaxID=273540 RepID=A0A9Q0KPL1_9MAGN|nr:hypothetical protein NE237_007488 [Protea cynaroides]